MTPFSPSVTAILADVQLLGIDVNATVLSSVIDLGRQTLGGMKLASLVLRMRYGLSTRNLGQPR